MCYGFGMEKYWNMLSWKLNGLMREGRYAVSNFLRRDVDQTDLLYDSLWMKSFSDSSLELLMSKRTQVLAHEMFYRAEIIYQFVLILNINQLAVLLSVAASKSLKTVPNLLGSFILCQFVFVASK